MRDNLELPDPKGNNRFSTQTKLKRRIQFNSIKEEPRV